MLLVRSREPALTCAPVSLQTLNENFVSRRRIRMRLHRVTASEQRKLPLPTGHFGKTFSGDAEITNELLLRTERVVMLMHLAQEPVVDPERRGAAEHGVKPTFRAQRGLAAVDPGGDLAGSELAEAEE